MVASLSIAFHQHNAAFYPDQTVAGVVIMTIKKTVKVKGLFLFVTGKGACTLSDSLDDDIKAENIKQLSKSSGRELYVNFVTDLLGAKSGDAITIPPGTYSYAFAYQLPDDIPSSFEKASAYVRYKVVVKLSIRSQSDYQSKRTFRVVRNDDLNFFPELRMRCEAVNIKRFSKFICGFGSLLLKVELPQTGFALGERIPVSIELVNISTKCVTHTSVALKRLERFNGANNKVRKTRHKIAEVHSTGAAAGKHEILNVLIKVPRNISPSNDRYCKVYQVTYEIKVTAEIKGFHSSPFVRIPITIGSIGLLNVTGKSHLDWNLR